MHIIVMQITNHLFEDPGEKFGMDLVALNLQRAREFGVPGYTAYRQVGIYMVCSINMLFFVQFNCGVNIYC